ncbi:MULTISPECIES: hypothetical protein [unclassified Lentimicrobium]|uniref:hypothetical protein n=1 Tax=unclassified Lentimicrobium TaxID=2677434 RepID=UPI0015532D87|nr:MULTISPECIES: hypothetical protein [unclassified Lentimicrobium]NPD45477.1 hypothetical protein [Lentimicrobium sp. S6]NPD86108.1 hypothetical protein [Lentimicrobium sp. L6]
MRYYLNYNDNGYKTSSEEYWDTDHWSFGQMEKLKHSKNYSTYHLQKLRRYSESENWILYEVQSSNYNEDSTILSSFLVKIEAETTDTLTVTHTYYDNEGNWILYENFKKQDEDWYLHYKVIWTYNSENLISESLSFTEYDGALINNNKSIFKYDEHNYLSYEASYDWDKNDEIWEYDVLTTYENDSNGNILKRYHHYQAHLA